MQLSKTSTVTLALMLCLASALGAADPVKPVEQGIEAQSSDFVLPSTNEGALFFGSCNGCKLNQLRLTPHTQFSARNQSLSFKELQQLLQKGGPYFVMIYRDIKEPIVTRIVVHADFPTIRGKS